MRTITPFAIAAIALSAPTSAAQVVPTPAFQSVQLMGGGQITVRPGRGQRVVIMNGSATVTKFRVEDRGKLTIRACERNCPRNYNLQILIESPRVPDLAVMGGGQISTAAGFVPQRKLATAVHGGGTINATNLDAGSVSAAVNGGGTIRVQARSHLSAAVRGGGSVAYAGNPHVSSAIAGGGSVSRLR